MNVTVTSGRSACHPGSAILLQGLRADTTSHLEVSICFPTVPCHAQTPSHPHLCILHLVLLVQLIHPINPMLRSYVYIHRYTHACQTVRVPIFSPISSFKFELPFVRLRLDLNHPSPMALGIASAKIHPEERNRKSASSSGDVSPQARSPWADRLHARVWSVQEDMATFAYPASTLAHTFALMMICFVWMAS